MEGANAKVPRNSRANCWKTTSARPSPPRKIRKTGQKATEELFKQFQTVSNSVASLNDRVGRNDALVETVQKALSSPGGAGQFAEIGLENSLKSFGLQSGRDYIIQQTLEADDGSRVRPDAVVFLPSDSVLVIDCKASKFLFDLAAAEHEDARQALQRTCGGPCAHIYAHSVAVTTQAHQADYRRAGKSSEIRRTLNVMYLPNEGAIEKISEIDPTSRRKRQNCVLLWSARRDFSLSSPLPGSTSTLVSRPRIRKRSSRRPASYWIERLS